MRVMTLWVSFVEFGSVGDPRATVAVLVSAPRCVARSVSRIVMGLAALVMEPRSQTTRFAAVEVQRGGLAATKSARPAVHVSWTLTFEAAEGPRLSTVTE
jgi:hypothetical protein